MSAGAYLSQVEQEIAALEAYMARVRAGDIRLSVQMERQLRGVLDVLLAEAQFRRVSDHLVLDPTSARTQQAIARAYRELDDWAVAAKTAFHSDASTMALLRDTTARLAEMNRILDDVAGSWTSVITRLSDPKQFTAAQVAEAKQLSKDTAFYRRQFGRTRRYLASVGSQASFGKSENMAAEVDRVHRAAQNFVAEFGSGTPLFRSAEGVRAGESSVDELRDFRGSVAFNRNNLELSIGAHMRGLVSAAFIALAQPLGVCHFMMYVSKANRSRTSGYTAAHLFDVRLGQPHGGAIGVVTLIDRVAAALGREVGDVRAEATRRALQGGDGTPAGIRKMLNRMLTQGETGATWLEVFAGMNKGRRDTVVWGAPLPAHHGSLEFYVPVPPAMVGEMRAWSAARRTQVAA